MSEAKSNTSIRNISIKLPHDVLQSAISGAALCPVRIPLMFKTRRNKVYMGEVVVMPPAPKGRKRKPKL